MFGIGANSTESEHLALTDGLEYKYALATSRLIWAGIFLLSHSKPLRASCQVHISGVSLCDSPGNETG